QPRLQRRVRVAIEHDRTISESRAMLDATGGARRNRTARAPAVLSRSLNRDARRDSSMDLLTCVKCTSVLDKSKIGGVEVDLCPACGGLWLDQGEIEKI